MSKRGLHRLLRWSTAPRSEPSAAARQTFVLPRPSTKPHSKTMCCSPHREGARICSGGGRLRSVAAPVPSALVRINLPSPTRNSLPAGVPTERGHVLQGQRGRRRIPAGAGQKVQRPHRLRLHGGKHRVVARRRVSDIRTGVARDWLQRASPGGKRANLPLMAAGQRRVVHEKPTLVGQPGERADERVRGRKERLSLAGLEVQRVDVAGPIRGGRHRDRQFTASGLPA